MISMVTHIQLRQMAMNWALSQAEEGETQEGIIARAQAYLDFVLYPARPDVAAAMCERQTATVQ